MVMRYVTTASYFLIQLGGGSREMCHCTATVHRNQGWRQIRKVSFGYRSIFGGGVPSSIHSDMEKGEKAIPGGREVVCVMVSPLRYLRCKHALAWGEIEALVP